MALMRFDERGDSRASTYFWLTFLGVIIYLGIMILPPIVTFELLEADIESEAGNAHFYDDDTIRKHIVSHVAHWDVPVGNDDIIIERGDAEIRITIEYTIPRRYFGYYQRDFNFRVFTVKSIKKT